MTGQNWYTISEAPNKLCGSPNGHIGGPADDSAHFQDEFLKWTLSNRIQTSSLILQQAPKALFRYQTVLRTAKAFCLNERQREE